MEIDEAVHKVEADILDAVETDSVLSTTIIAPAVAIFVPTTIEFFPLGLVLLIICLVGLIGNALCVLVLLRPKMKSTYSTTTLGLTLFDVIYLLTKLSRYAIPALLTYYAAGRYYTHIFLPIVGPELRAITFTAHTGSTYFTIIVALDRYIAVTWPIQSKYLWSRVRVVYCCGLVIIFAILFNLPRWWEFRTEPVLGNNEEVIAYEMKVTEFRKDPEYKVVYTFWMYFVVMFLIPFVSLTYLNYTIGLAIWNANQNREQLSITQKRDNSFGLMLIAVVFVFLICSVDYLVIDWLEYYNIDVPEFWYSLGNVLLTVNSSINFIIYCVFGKRFRNEFLKMMKDFRLWSAGKIKQRHKDHPGNSMTSTTFFKTKSKWYSDMSSSSGTHSDDVRI